MTKWVVTTATERITLDATRAAEVTFTVTNQSAKTARALLEIQTGTGVEESWFTIEEPVRPIRPAASVPFTVPIKVSAAAAPGSYEFEARVSSSIGAPEENFVLSRRVLLEVPAPPAPPKKGFPWWIIVAAALLALVIGVVTWLVWPADTEPTVEPTPTPAPVVSAEPVEYVTVPKVAGVSLADARTAIEAAGLSLGVIQYRLGPGGPAVSRQSLIASTEVPKGSKMDLELIAAATKPVISSPNNNSSVPPNTMPQIAWTQTDPWVGKWIVTVTPEQCTKGIGGAEVCVPVQITPARLVVTKQYQPPLPALTYTPDPARPNVRYNGWIVVRSCVLDDLGGQGECGLVRFFLEH
jgi:hypothetical protein